MIQLTRLNNHPLMINSDLIKFVEKAPDTVLTLITGEKVIVLESADVILGKIVAFRQSIIAGQNLHAPELTGANTTSTPTPLPNPTAEES
ncbi:MAG: flagellar FlbD family protein [Candidatus Acidiferrum sp.]